MYLHTHWEGLFHTSFFFGKILLLMPLSKGSEYFLHSTLVCEIHFAHTLWDRGNDSITVCTSASINGPFTPYLLRCTLSLYCALLNKDTALVSNSFNVMSSLYTLTFDWMHIQLVQKAADECVTFWRNTHSPGRLVSHNTLLCSSPATQGERRDKLWTSVSWRRLTFGQFMLQKEVVIYLGRKDIFQCSLFCNYLHFYKLFDFLEVNPCLLQPH